MISTPDVARVHPLKNNLRVLPRRFAWATLLILAAAIPVRGITQYSGAAVALDGSINGWGVTDAHYSGMYHTAYVSNTLTSPNGRTASSGWRNAGNWVRADVYLGWDATDLGTYLATSNHKFYCPYAGTVLRPNTSGSTTVYDFTVTISAQEILPRETGTPYQMTVTVQTNPYVSRTVTFGEVRIAATTAGHEPNHPTTLPSGMGGSFNPASDNTSSSTGRLTSTYTAPSPAGEYQIKATIEGRTRTAPSNLTVKFSGLAELSTGTGYMRRGQTPNHSLNWHATTGTRSSLQAIGTEYDRLYNQTDYRVLGYNDISLPWGGLFDIGPPDYVFWQPPHSAHRKGIEIDIYCGAGTSRPDFVPEDRRAGVEAIFSAPLIGNATAVANKCTAESHWHVTF